MTRTTFLQIRPVDTVSDVWAATRRREGMLAVGVEEPTEGDVEQALKAGLLLVSSTTMTEAPAYAVSPSGAHELARLGVEGWRITVIDEGDEMELLGAVAMSGAAFVRVSRSRVGAVADQMNLPGVSVAISTFVDTVEDAVSAVNNGATDLLLRDWGTERVGNLRDSLASGSLVERTAFPLGLGHNTVTRAVSRGAASAYLNQVDGSGRARPRSEWAPGRDMELPKPADRISAAWPDDAWREAPGVFATDADPVIKRILASALAGTAPTRDEVEVLFGAHGADVEAIADTADTLRSRTVGDSVSFVVNRNINYTNQCYFKCGFCAFSKGPRSLDLRGEPYLMSIDDIVERATEASQLGATEVCLQGGIHPEFTGQFYVDVVDAVKAANPDLHIHGFTPLEIWQGAETAGFTIREFLVKLKAAGLGTLPGTAAEILDDEVRLNLCPDKIRTSQWSEVMLAAHEVGIPSTATIMFGHVDGPASWANHIEVIREIQRRTGGFTEFVPLPFVHMGSPIWLRGEARPGPTWDEVILMHAVSRIAFLGLIDNIQASWVKLGLEGAEALLRSGCNDVGGTLMDESISRAAGADHGTSVEAADLRELILDLDRQPVRRSTTYEAIETRITIL